MNVLLLRLCGPMQSWGVQSHFSVRDTGLEPSKSGVIGLVAAALGRPRSADVSDLAGLAMGTRVDAEGVLRYDYQTALDVLKAGGGLKDTEPSRRYYLADARFLVGLAGEDLCLLQTIQAALQDPVWALYLGRKAFVPSTPVWLPDGLRRDADLADTLAAYPWLGGPGGLPDQLRLVLENSSGPEVRKDVPECFAHRDRYVTRRLVTTFIQTQALQPVRAQEEG